MTIWQQVTLGDVITLQRGHDLTEPQRSPGSVPVIGSAGPNGWHSVARAPGPGVTVGRSGASAGVVTYVKVAYWPHNTALYVRDFKGNDPLFVANLLRTMPLAELNSGSAQPSLNRNFLYPLPVCLPPVGEQRRIASILGAYDDLIEVNRRRVALLEGMARGLFEEWFVRFRFPGHEAVPMVDTPNGPLPEGWSLQGLGELGTLRSGSGKLTKAAYLADGVRAYSASGPDGFVEQAECSGPAVIVSAVGAYCGRTWLAEGDWTCIANTFAVIPNQGVPAEFLYLGTLGYEKWPRRGAAQPFIAKADARTIVLPQPTRDVWDSFCGLARPTLKLVELLSETNKSLATSRDLLLPRLISGQLSVTTAERELEDAA